MRSSKLKIKPEIHEKAWGHEEWFHNGSYCMKKLVLNKGWRCSMHFHKIKDEVFYLVKGKVLLEMGGLKLDMVVGDAIRVTPGTPHRFSGVEDSELIECSSHHKDEDSVRIELSGQYDIKKG